MSEHTCETCDWYCYGTWDGNTCDKWERTVWETPVPDDIINAAMGLPTSEDYAELRAEIERLDDEIEGMR